MDVITLTALLTPCLPFLMKLGQKAAESASGKIGEDSWNTAKKIWDKLHPKLEAKEDAKIAAQQLAAKPDSEARKAVFQEELETLLEENPDLVEAIAKIRQEDSPTATGTQISQTVTNNEGQAINQMKDSKAIGRIDGHIQGGVNL
jgi:type II secretory pathway component PulF